MAFTKTFHAPNGALLEYHQITRAEMTADGITLHVKSWPDEAASLAGKPSLFTSYVILPAGDMLATLQAQLLAEPGGDFSGGDPGNDPLPPLEQAKAKRWEAIKAERDRREQGTFDWNGQTFKVDVQRLTGAALDAFIALQSGETYEEPWVLDNNTIVVLSAEDQIAVGRACKARVSEIWAISQQLRAHIQEAETVEAVQLIGWPAPE